ncbi:TetR/AcrR family transcriptional regulator [Streptomyces sp. McG3]|uniref:TetR/AcrR family transcriptional regulator n=1 Tax=Streptomyces sp. McG3 TaxID=2725483 RepID=UPI001BEADC09|nr:helix-turn-helix domain-containing protein [Streptomyces sp. McG3]MBT2898892.1 helix-turn-helix transcriptional regulator [Streptomyces sp. McG3]
MSEIRRRRQRVEVARNRAALVSAAIQVLAEHPEASMSDIASEAGVTRQTAYVHFGTREALLAAVRDELSRRAFTVLDAADLAADPATEALGRFLAAVGKLLAEQASFGHTDGDSETDASRHLLIEQRLGALIRRGRDSGEFTTELETNWLVAATIALGHAADHQIRIGRLGARVAARHYRASVMRLYGAHDPDHSP